MAQQVFDKSWPLGKNGASELIPGGAILQTRDGKDEPITLSASFQLGEGGLFLPTDKDNPLEVRVRELEKLIGEIAANPTANTVQARLKALADRLGEAVASPSEHTLLARLAALEEDLGEIKAALESGDAKVTLTGHSIARFSKSVTSAQWISVGSGQRRVVGMNNVLLSTSSSGANFQPIDLTGLERLCLFLENPSTSGSFRDWRLVFYDTLTPLRTAFEYSAARMVLDWEEVPALGVLFKDLTPYLHGFKGLGLHYHPASSAETVEYTFRWQGIRKPVEVTSE